MRGVKMPIETRIRRSKLVIAAGLALLLSGCGNNDLVIPGGSGSALPAFDPTTATARVFGKVSIEGKPEIPKLQISRDEFCKTNAQKIFKQGTLVSEEGLLRNVIVYVRSGYEGRSYKAP